MNITIMDTTLRDGEQTSGVSFTDDEKLNIAKQLLGDLKVDRLEIASARVSEGELTAVKNICNWAKENGHIEKIEVLGFVDGKSSVDWIVNAGGKVLNLLTKGSLKHVEGQLRKTPEEHITDIKNTVDYATSQGLRVNIYLETWSNGMRDSQDYVFYMMDELKNTEIDRYMLPDTLGILNPDETYEFCKKMVDNYPSLKFDFHPHNDYDLASGNVFSAIKAGINCVHTTINGLGERAGNVPLSSVIVIVKDHFKYDMQLDETKMNKVSRLVESFSGIRIPPNKPIIGAHVFTQTSGVHADGDNKDNLYFNALLPERFNRRREYALGKLSGKANIKKNLDEMGIDIDAESMKKVTQRIIELGDMKETITQEDLPYIISDVLRSKAIKEKIQVLNFNLSLANGLKPVASLKLKIDGDVFEESAVGDGQYDAFMKALRKIYAHLEKSLPRLIDYSVSIPPGGRTDALVQTLITWKYDREFKTRGLAPDQTIAAIKATVKMLNIIENEYPEQNKF